MFFSNKKGGSPHEFFGSKITGVAGAGFIKNGFLRGKHQGSSPKITSSQIGEQLQSRYII